MPMATTPPPQKCIMLSSHGAFQYKEKNQADYLRSKKKNQKRHQYFIKIFSKNHVVSQKTEWPSEANLPSRSQVGALFNGCQILRRDSSSRQNNGLPRNKISRKFAPMTNYIIALLKTISMTRETRKNLHLDIQCPSAHSSQKLKPYPKSLSF